MGFMIFDIGVSNFLVTLLLCYIYSNTHTLTHMHARFMVALRKRGMRPYNACVCCCIWKSHMQQFSCMIAFCNPL